VSVVYDCCGIGEAVWDLFGLGGGKGDGRRLFPGRSFGKKVWDWRRN